jgi:GNAT superfamily N-acetyltransferase
MSDERRTDAEVRIAAAGEQDAVVAMIAGFRDFYEESTPDDATIERMVAQLIEDDRTDFLLVGEPAVGFAAIRYRPSVWTGVEDAWLEDVFVVESERGKGTGRALLEACLERAAERGCKRVQLDANERNEGAVVLYESLGFRNRVPDRFDDGRNLYFTRWLNAE